MPGCCVLDRRVAQARDRVSRWLVGLREGEWGVVAPDQSELSGCVMRFAVLGTLTVEGPDGPVELGAPKQRAVLALLLLSANRVVSVDRIIDHLWSGEPPPGALGTVHAYVSVL